MVELKSVIDETFNNLKSKIEEEYNNKIKEHFTKISIDVCNDSYSKDEYGKIDIGKIKHPEGRYIIHKVDFEYESCGTMLIDNFGERYVFLKTVYHYTVGYNNASMMRYTNGAHSPNIKGNPHHSVNITNIIEFEYQLIPSKNEYEYPLTNRIIDFVKSQNFPIEDLNTLSKIMASIEIYKKTYNKKEYNKQLKLNEEQSNEIKKEKELNKLLQSKLNELSTKYNEQIKLNEELVNKIKDKNESIEILQSKLHDEIKESDNIYQKMDKLKDLLYKD